MVADKGIEQDGQFYTKGSEIWELGSWVAVEVLGPTRHYKGLSVDVQKLPHYAGTGSTAECIDTGDVYKFEKTTDTWYLHKSSGGGSVNGPDLSDGTVDAVLKTITAVDSISMGRKDETQTGPMSQASGSAVTASGLAAHAEGENTEALGEAAHAEGRETIASAAYSHSEGNRTRAAAQASHAEGNNTEASAQYAHAEGSSTKASGYISHAEGRGSTAEGAETKALKQGAHAEGSQTTASASCAHAEGSGTAASGSNAHAEGSQTIASGSEAHAEGSNTKALKNASHVEDSSTEASGPFSHAEGNNTKASGPFSHSEGFNTVAASNMQHVQGRYNLEDTGGVYAHIVGNGQYSEASGEVERANAHTLDWEGNAWYAGTLECSGLVRTDTADSTTRYLVQVAGGQLTVTEIVTDGTRQQ